jgi:hypothetical protein
VEPFIVLVQAPSGRELWIHADPDSGTFVHESDDGERVEALTAVEFQRQFPVAAAYVARLVAAATDACPPAAS